MFIQQLVILLFISQTILMVLLQIIQRTSISVINCSDSRYFTFPLQASVVNRMMVGVSRSSSLKINIFSALFLHGLLFPKNLRFSEVFQKFFGLISGYIKICIFTTFLPGFLFPKNLHFSAVFRSDFYVPKNQHFFSTFSDWFLRFSTRIYFGCLLQYV